MSEGDDNDEHDKDDFSRRAERLTRRMTIRVMKCFSQGMLMKIGARQLRGQGMDGEIEVTRLFGDCLKLECILANL